MELYNALQSWIASDDGATAIEYALMAALIALTIIPAVIYLGATIKVVLYDPIVDAF